MWHWPCPHGMMLLLPIGTRSITRVKRATRIGADQVWQIDLHTKSGTCTVARRLFQPLVTQWKALLRHELLAHLPEWLSRKAGVLGCTSSPTILFMCWKEIFPNEDATRFDLVDELAVHFVCQQSCLPACSSSQHGLRIG